jgi:hypothetical protein
MAKRLDEKAELQRAQKYKQAARDCIARGWKPLAVRRGNKGPDSEGWPQWPVGDADTYMKEHFANIPLANVAIQMGALSGGLTDVDLDCREAVYLAPHLLPDTGAVFGRPSTSLALALHH